MSKQRGNTLKHASAGVMIFALIFLPLGAVQGGSTPPAPTPFYTPTPLPAIVAASDYAASKARAARADMAEVATLEARAAEIRNNAQAQSIEAERAYSDARAATAAQNAAAIGEAIGRGESALDQMRQSVNGQTDIIATLTVRTQIQSGDIISMAQALQRSKDDAVKIQTTYTALAKKQVDDNGNSTVTYIVVAFVFLAFFALIVWGISQVKQRNNHPRNDDISESAQTIIYHDDDEQ